MVAELNFTRNGIGVVFAMIWLLLLLVFYFAQKCILKSHVQYIEQMLIANVRKRTAMVANGDGAFHSNPIAVRQANGNIKSHSDSFCFVGFFKKKKRNFSTRIFVRYFFVFQMLVSSSLRNKSRRFKFANLIILICNSI